MSQRLGTQEQAIKERFVKAVGPWNPSWDEFVRLDPNYVSTYTTYVETAQRNRALPEKIRHLIYLTTDATVTRAYIPGIRKHMRSALEAGATIEEVTEVLELTSTVGIHAISVGVPLLSEVLQEEGKFDPKSPLDDKLEKIKHDFITTRGYWHPMWEDVLRMDPDFFNSYIDYSGAPWKTGTLEPKFKELVYCAFDASTTHLYEPGLKLHMRNAVRYGATKEEIMEVLAITSTQGHQTINYSTPVMLEELALKK